jgi:hypothetical protein
VKGNQFAQVLPQLGMILLFAVVMLIIAVKRYRNKLD